MVLFCFVVSFCLVLSQVWLCSPDCPETCYVPQASFVFVFQCTSPCPANNTVEWPSRCVPILLTLSSLVPSSLSCFLPLNLSMTYRKQFKDVCKEEELDGKTDIWHQLNVIHKADHHPSQKLEQAMGRQHSLTCWSLAPTMEALMSSTKTTFLGRGGRSLGAK